MLQTKLNRKRKRWNLIPVPLVSLYLWISWQFFCIAKEGFSALKKKKQFEGTLWVWYLNEPEKTADIWRRNHWFPCQMKSEKRAQKFHTDDVSLPRSWWCFWLVESNFPRVTTNQKRYPDLGSDASSVWNFCARFSDVIWRENQ